MVSQKRTTDRRLQVSQFSCTLLPLKAYSCHTRTVLSLYLQQNHQISKGLFIKENYKYSRLNKSVSVLREVLKSSIITTRFLKVITSKITNTKWHHKLAVFSFLLPRMSSGTFVNCGSARVLCIGTSAHVAKVTILPWTIHPNPDEHNMELPLADTFPSS